MKSRIKKGDEFEVRNYLNGEMMTAIVVEDSYFSEGDLESDEVVGFRIGEKESVAYWTLDEVWEVMDGGMSDLLEFVEEEEDSEILYRVIENPEEVSVEAVKAIIEKIQNWVKDQPISEWKRFEVATIKFSDEIEPKRMKEIAKPFKANLVALNDSDRPNNCIGISLVYDSYEALPGVIMLDSEEEADKTYIEPEEIDEEEDKFLQRIIDLFLSYKILID